jgi:hypothetical protein
MKRITFFGMFALIFFVCAVLIFTACTARINGSLSRNGSADLNVNVALEPRMTALIRTLASASGAQSGAPILDAASIAKSMAAAPGIASASFKNTSPSAIEGTVKITNVGNFLSDSRRQGSKRLDFIHFEQGASGGRCTLSMTLDSGPEILSLLSPEFSDYLNSLQAPLATGEALTKTEYLELMGEYSKGIADEISRASIRVSIDFPGQVQSASGGTFSGTRADFTIPLPDILTLEKPLRYEVVWK